MHLLYRGMDIKLPICITCSLIDSKLNVEESDTFHMSFADQYLDKGAFEVCAFASKRSAYLHQTKQGRPGNLAQRDGTVSRSLIKKSVIAELEHVPSYTN